MDRLVYETLRLEGRFVPQSPEEVARAEAEINEAAAVLPPGLRDPLALLNSQIPLQGAIPPQPPGGETAPPVPPSRLRTTPPADHKPAEPSVVASLPDNRSQEQENPVRGTHFRKMIAWLVVVGTVGTVVWYQFF